MSDYAWPWNLPDPHVPLSENISMLTVRTPFEAGYVQTRARFTKSRRSFSLVWTFMSVADRDILVQFYEETVKGGAESFDWTHPTDGTSYEVRFKADSLAFQTIAKDLFSVSCELEEV